MHAPVAAVVIDCGSHTVKAGFSDGDAPRAVFPAVVGRSRVGVDCYVGDEAMAEGRTFSFPVRNGLVAHWGGHGDRTAPHLQQRAADRCRGVPGVADRGGAQPASTERAAQVMFETFSVPGLFLEKQSVLALLATRRTTGLVLQCGHGYTRAVPILDGKILRGVASVDVTGATVSHDLRERLRGALKLTLETADDMKRATCYVRGDGEPPQLAPGSAQVEWIRSRPERFECPEALFRGNVALDEADTTASSEWQRVRLLWIGRSDPSCVFFGASKDVVRLIQKRCARVGLFRILRAAELKGIQGAIARSVAGWERDVCDKLCRNIVLAGDTTKLPGFAERLQKELAVAIPYAESIVVEQAPEYPAWFGGAHLASQESFQSSWIPKNEYDETGPSIMTRRRRCY